MQEYAASLISDPNHSGHLKCPSCPRLLRVEDAMVALDKQSRAKRGSTSKYTSMKVLSNQALNVLEQWDTKVRNEMLRSMGDFRPCPHCSNHLHSSYKHNNNQGGGFVSPECLAQINDEREAIVERLLKLTGTPSAIATVISYAIYYLNCSAGETTSISNGGPISVYLQLASALIPSLLLPILPHALGVMLALVARKILLSPIGVNCPCCYKDFNLEASSELQLAGGASSGDGAEAATQQWKLSHTRPCPGCASPIIKDGGCNHVRCGRCRVEFCWACMRTRTSCKAFQCKNGAPFGNAVGIGSLLRNEEIGLTLVERIGRAESVSWRNLRSLRTVVACYGAWISVRFVPLPGASNARSVLAAPLSRLWYPFVYILTFLVLRMLISDRVRRSNPRPIIAFDARIGQPPHVQFGFRDEDQLAEAIARSLVEQ